MPPQPKTVLHLSAMDTGGAGQFAVDFHHLLSDEGYHSYLVVIDSKSNYNDIILYPHSKTHRIIPKLMRKLDRNLSSALQFDYDYYFYNRYEKLTVASANKILQLLPEKPDVIFIHWVTDFVNAKIINDLHRLTGANLFWLMLDNAPLTGGCHYPWSCTGYQLDCGVCPAILTPKLQSLAKLNLAFKQKYLPDNLTLITFSETDYKRAVSSTLFQKRNVLKILGFVDESVFKPGNQNEAKGSFGFSADEKIIFFGASSPKERRKGMSLLLNALSQLEGENYRVLIAGIVNFSLEGLPEAKLSGPLSQKDLIMAYQAADVFVCPSLEDSGPMMINQALMCGTPVVAFNVGVANDLVITGKTGYSAQPENMKDLAKGIDYILGLDDRTYMEMAGTCRTFAVSGYSKSLYLNQMSTILSSEV